MLGDLKSKAREVVEVLSISHGLLVTNFTGNHPNRMTTSNGCFALLNPNRRFITLNELLTTKQQSKHAMHVVKSHRYISVK